MGYLGATLTQVFTRAGGEDVSLRDVTIVQLGNGSRECGWRHAPEAHGIFGGFWKSQLSWEYLSWYFVVFHFCFLFWWLRWERRTRNEIGVGKGRKSPIPPWYISSRSYASYWMDREKKKQRKALMQNYDFLCVFTFLSDPLTWTSKSKDKTTS